MCRQSLAPCKECVHCPFNLVYHFTITSPRVFGRVSVRVLVFVCGRARSCVCLPMYEAFTDLSAYMDERMWLRVYAFREIDLATCALITSRLQMLDVWIIIFSLMYIIQFSSNVCGT